MLMKNVGHLTKTLLASATLEEALNGIGKTKRFRSGHIVFHAGDRDEGVFLVCNGKVCLRVPGAPHLDRVFSAGSVLGLPSTFNRQPYSLTAVCATDCEVAHVSEKEFLDLMAVRPDLCRESTAILSREVAFILSAASVVGLWGNFGQTNYVASKAGVIGMTRTWARELGKYKIRVNAVAPGFIATDMVRAMPGKVLEAMIARTPLGRAGKPEDVANAYVWLASEQASFVHGAVISVDGGVIIGT